MPESIGSTLKQRREARHLSIQQVAEQTRVRMHYLQALENDDLSAIPSMVQARGFLRIYAEFLGLKLEDLSSMSRSNESQSIASTAASPAEALPVSAQANVPASDSRPRLTLFSGLRDRFARHPALEDVSHEPEPSTSPEPQAEPEIFVPVRSHEELPASPEQTHAPEPKKLIVEPDPAVKPARVRKPSSKKTSNKKPVRTKAETKTPMPAKPSKVSAGRQARVKKKIMEFL